MPRLVEMQEEYAYLNLKIIGISDASAQDIKDFSSDQGLNFPIQYKALAMRRAFGVSLIWGATHYLIDPSGQIVSEGLDRAEEHLDNAQADN